MTPDQVFQRFERDPEAFARVPTATYRLQRTPVETLQRHGMGQIMDVVPNHMGIAGSRNAWWTDVLENGQASAYARFFDIEWEPIKPELKDKVLLPMLGDQYGRVLENQELQLEFRDGAFSVRYYDSALPVAPGSYVDILEMRLDELQQALGADHPHLLELRSVITALGHLPPQTERTSGGAPAREGGRQAPPGGAEPRVGGGAGVPGRQRARLQRSQGRRGDLRPAGRLADAPGVPARLLADRR